MMTFRGRGLPIGSLIACAFMSGCGDREGKHEDAGFIELASFSLKKDVPEETLLKAFDAAQHGFFKRQTGYCGRKLARNSNGEYMEMIYWEDKQRADTAYAAFYKNPDCISYIGLLNPSADTSRSVKRVQVLKRYE